MEQGQSVNAMHASPEGNNIMGALDTVEEKVLGVVILPVRYSCFGTVL